MKHLVGLLGAVLLAFAAHAADPLDGVAPMAKDDLAALERIKATPERHVLLYFGDHLN